MSRNRVRKLFCRTCEYELDRIEYTHQMDTDWLLQPIALKCGLCHFEVYGTVPPIDFEKLENSALKLGARTYVLHNQPVGGYIPF